VILFETVAKIQQILERKENIYRILRSDPRNQTVRPDFFRLHQKS